MVQSLSHGMTSAYEQKSESADPKELFDVLLLLLDYIVWYSKFRIIQCGI